MQRGVEAAVLAGLELWMFHLSKARRGSQHPRHTVSHLTQEGTGRGGEGACFLSPPHQLLSPGTSLASGQGWEWGELRSRH